jgi:hypothetical protein
MDLRTVRGVLSISISGLGKVVLYGQPEMERLIGHATTSFVLITVMGGRLAITT